MKELHGSAGAGVAAPVEECFEFLAAVGRYPQWYPEVVRRVEVVARDEQEWPRQARALLHLSYGPVVKDFDLLLDVVLDPPRGVDLTRIANEPSDRERFEVRWRLSDNAGTRVALTLSAELDVPRLLPLGSVGDAIAGGFVSAAKRAIEGA